MIIWYYCLEAAADVNAAAENSKPLWQSLKDLSYLELLLRKPQGKMTAGCSLRVSRLPCQLQSAHRRNGPPHIHFIRCLHISICNLERPFVTKIQQDDY